MEAIHSISYAIIKMVFFAELHVAILHYAWPRFPIMVG